MNKIIKVTVGELIKQLSQYDPELTCGVYVGTTSYGSYYLYSDGCTMLVSYKEDGIDKPDEVFVLPSGLSMDDE